QHPHRGARLVRVRDLARDVARGPSGARVRGLHRARHAAPPAGRGGAGGGAGARGERGVAASRRRGRRGRGTSGRPGRSRELSSQNWRKAMRRDAVPSKAGGGWSPTPHPGGEFGVRVSAAAWLARDRLYRATGSILFRARAWRNWQTRRVLAPVGGAPSGCWVSHPPLAFRESFPSAAAALRVPVRPPAVRASDAGVPLLAPPG